MKKALLVFVLLGATFALYFPSWQNPFVLDDLTKIQENVDLHAPFDIGNFIYPYAVQSMHFRNDPSRPLVFLLYWACWQSADGAPAPFHVVNTLFHGLSAGLLALLTAEAAGGSLIAGFFAGALFLSSPLMAGTAVYAYGLSDLLSTTFILAALLVLRSRRPLWGLPLYVLALASKQSAVVLPALLYLVEWFSGERPRLDRLKKVYAPLAALTVAYLLWRLYFFGELGDIEGRGNGFPLGDYLPVEGVMIFKYLKLTFWPAQLSVDHALKPADYAVWTEAVAWLAVVGVTVAALRVSARNSWRHIALGWCVFLVCLLPTSSVFPTVDLFVERRAYTADLGVFLAIGVSVYFLFRKSRAAAALLVGALISVQCWLTLSREEVYASPAGLWRESLGLNPQNPRALINLGVYYSAVGKWDESRQVLEELLKLQPANGSIYSKLAYIYQQPTYAQHSDDMTWSYLQKALSMDPENVYALFNAGVYQQAHRQFAEAETFFLRATQLSPRMDRAWYAAGQAALAQNKNEAARDDFRQVLLLNPQSQPARESLRKLGVTDIP